MEDNFARIQKSLRERRKLPIIMVNYQLAVPKLYKILKTKNQLRI